MGKLSCLSVNDGDIEISFDTEDCAEAIRAKRIITDMLKRGYALLIKMADGRYVRAHEFDEKQGVYVIADYDPQEEIKTDDKEEISNEKPEPTLKKADRRTKQYRRQTMSSSEVVAVAPSAGG